MIKLVFGLVLEVTKRSFGIVVQILGLHFRNSKVVKLIVELHHGCPSSDQSVETLLYGLSHLYEPIDGHSHKSDW